MIIDGSLIYHIAPDQHAADVRAVVITISMHHMIVSKLFLLAAPHLQNNYQTTMITLLRRLRQDILTRRHKHHR